MKYEAKTEMIIDGYIEGMDRGGNGDKKVSHLYKGDFNDPGLPMCKRGWNRGEDGYSIFRANSSPAGTCQICLSRALANRDGVLFPFDTDEPIEPFLNEEIELAPA